MNRRIFANLILYDIRKGFRENKIKWIVGVFIFVFFSFITVSDFSVNSPELGFLAYFTNILQGMPPYIKTDDSVFTIPVSWFLFYAFLFFVVGFYPLSDLYGAGKKTLILSGSRFKWLWSKLHMDAHKCDYVLCCNDTCSCGCDMCNREVEHKA